MHNVTVEILLLFLCFCPMAILLDKENFLSSFPLRYIAKYIKTPSLVEVTSLKNPPEVKPLCAKLRSYGGGGGVFLF